MHFAQGLSRWMLSVCNQSSTSSCEINTKGVLSLTLLSIWAFADFIVSILVKLYNRVVVPPEAPEKGDNGDIDFLADEPLLNFTSQNLELSLGASAHTKAGSTTSFAIRVSEHSNNFFQLDVHVCKKGCFEWESVIYAYGDLWHIIGSIVTRFGLGINDHGLHARVEEIEETNKKVSLLHLTSEPHEMMAFLGLDDLRYERSIQWD